MNVSSVVTLQFSFNDFTQQGGFSYIAIYHIFLHEKTQTNKKFSMDMDA